MPDREPVARCPHCVELNVLSARYCKHCGHEAHGYRKDCRCRRCQAAIDAVLASVGRALDGVYARRVA